MRRRIHTLMRRGGRLASHASHASIPTPDAVGTSGFGTGGTNLFSMPTNALPASEVMAISVMFRLDASPGGWQRLASKHTGSSDWSIALVSGRIQFLCSGVSTLSYYFTSDDLGKTFIATWTRDASGAQLYIYRDGDGTARRVAEDTTVSPPVSNPSWFMALGAYQVGSTGNGKQPLLDATLIGFSYGTSHISESAATAHARACVVLSSMSPSLPGVVSSYQATAGLETDQVGSNHLLRTGAAPVNLTNATFTAEYPGKNVDFHTLNGQSNAHGDQPAADYSAIGSPAVDYTAPFAGIRFARYPASVFSDLDDNGLVIGAASELRAGRDLVGENIHMHKIAVHGTSLYEDWAPPAIPQGSGGVTWNLFKSHVDALVHVPIGTGSAVASSKAQHLDTWSWKSLFWWQGEQDGASGHEVDSLAYEGRLGTFIDAIRAEWPSIIGADFRFVIARLSSSYQTIVTYRDNIIAAQNAVHALRTDTRMVNMDAMDGPDALHASAVWEVAAGAAWALASNADTDQTAVAP